MKAIQLIYSSMLILVMSTNALAQAAPPASPNDSLPDGPGKPIIQRACANCHSLKVIVSKKATKDDWTKTVNEMVTRGADLSDDEIDKAIDYLSTNFKPDDVKIEQSTAQTTMNSFLPLDQLAGVGPVARPRSLSLARYMAPFPGMRFESASPRKHVN